MELMIAIGIFSALGLLLAPLLAQGMSQWRKGEERREIYERAHLVLETIANDLACLHSEGGPRPGGEQHPVDVLLVGDGDAAGRSRLRFVRTLMGEGADPGNASAAAGRPDDGYTEYRTRIGDVGKKLRALRGLAEVAYVVGHQDAARHTLFRAERSPVGGPGSLFENAGFGDDAAIAARALPVAERVLLCRFLYWGQFTTSWDEEKQPGAAFGDDGGPHRHWDSTRGILPSMPRRRDRAPLSGASVLAVGPASRHDPVDDVFPTMVQVQLILEPVGPNAPSGALRAELSEKDRRAIADHANFPTEVPPGLDRLVLKIDDEWMEYNRAAGDGFQLGERGLFGTRPAKHADGAAIHTGLLFTRAVPIPARRNYWNG
jgi:hypothetical protein